MLDSVLAPQIQQPPFYLRSDRRDLASMPRGSEHLPVEERRVIDREKESADATRLHYFDVEPFRQHRDRAAAHQLLVSRLRQHRFTNREQHDHHRHAHAEAKEKQDGSPRPISDVAEGELANHGWAAPSTILPSRMWIFRRPASARS